MKILVTLWCGKCIGHKCISFTNFKP